MEKKNQEKGENRISLVKDMYFWDFKILRKIFLPDGYDLWLLRGQID
jgi:hypothetical protein